ncbi:phosphatase PAP2 family protein [Advenella kashmirensis]
MIRTRSYWPYYLAALACALFLLILINVRIDGRLFAVDQSIYRQLQLWRTSWLDDILITVTQLGDTLMVTVITGVITLWLLIRKSWRTAGYWLLTIIGSAIINTSIKAAIVRTRPGDMMYSGWSAYSFPSGHTTSNIVLYGLLCILIYPCIEKRAARILTVFCAMGFALLIAASRIYLGAHWFSDVLGGILVSTLILCVAGARYHAGRTHALTAGAFLIPIVATLLIVGSIHVWHGRHVNMQRYTPPALSDQAPGDTPPPTAAATRTP